MQLCNRKMSTIPSDQTCARWAHLSKSAPRYPETSKALIQSVGSEFPQLPTGFSNHISRRILRIMLEIHKNWKVNQQGPKTDRFCWKYRWGPPLLAVRIAAPTVAWKSASPMMKRTDEPWTVEVVDGRNSVKLLGADKNTVSKFSVMVRYIYLPRQLSLSLISLDFLHGIGDTPCCGWVILAKVAQELVKPRG